MDIERLEKLSELKEKGIITEEEFNAQKKELCLLKLLKRQRQVSAGKILRFLF